MASLAETWVQGRQGRLDPARLSKRVTTQRPSAGIWPPRFANAQGRQPIESLIRQALPEVRALHLTRLNSPDLLAELGELHAMGHQLDLGLELGEQARELLLQAQRLSPNDRRISDRLGTFCVTGLDGGHGEAPCGLRPPLWRPTSQS